MREIEKTVEGVKKALLNAGFPEVERVAITAVSPAGEGEYIFSIYIPFRVDSDGKRLP
jgi:hypothetical protein